MVDSIPYLLMISSSHCHPVFFLNKNPTISAGRCGSRCRGNLDLGNWSQLISCWNRGIYGDQAALQRIFSAYFAMEHGQFIADLPWFTMIYLLRWWYMVISHSKVPLYQRPCVFVLWGVLAIPDRNSKEDLDLMTPANTCRSSKSIRGARLFKKYTRKELLGVPGHLGPQKKSGTCS